MNRKINFALLFALVLGAGMTFMISGCKKGGGGASPAANPLKNTTWTIQSATDNNAQNVVAAYAGATLTFANSDTKNYTTTLDVDAQESGTYTYTLSNNAVTSITLTPNGGGAARTLSSVTLNGNSLSFTLDTRVKGDVDFVFNK